VPYVRGCMANAGHRKIQWQAAFCSEVNPLQSVRPSGKKLLDEGKLGKVYSFQLHCFWNRPAEYYTGWRGKAFPDGGTLYTQFSHYIDALIWLWATLKRYMGFPKIGRTRDSIEFEDTGVAALQLSSGIIGTLNWSVNTYQKNFEIGLTLIAEKGTFSLGGPYLNEAKYACMESPVKPYTGREKCQ
jgi:UDP-N-acetyl-2-amino-2-deoxyglucuronate dehydrogenase